MIRILLLTALAIGPLTACNPANRDPGTENTLVGAYHDQSTSEPEVRKAAEFAVTTQAGITKTEISLVKILTAESQVVAGTNFRMLLTVRIDGKEENAMVVVWRKLGGQHQLTSWKWQTKEV